MPKLMTDAEAFHTDRLISLPLHSLVLTMRNLTKSIAARERADLTVPEGARAASVERTERLREHLVEVRRVLAIRLRNASPAKRHSLQEFYPDTDLDALAQSPEAMDPFDPANASDAVPRFSINDARTHAVAARKSHGAVFTRLTHAFTAAKAKLEALLTEAPRGPLPGDTPVTPKDIATYLYKGMAEELRASADETARAVHALLVLTQPEDVLYPPPDPGDGAESAPGGK